MIPHLAMVLLVPAAILTWRHSRLVSGALWLTLATWLAYRGLRWAYPNAWAGGHLEWMRSASMVTGFVGWMAIEREANETRVRRSLVLAVLLVASMGVDLTAWLIHRGAGQWGPQPFFQCIVLLAMCAVSVWPRRQ